MKHILFFGIITLLLIGCGTPAAAIPPTPTMSATCALDEVQAASKLLMSALAQWQDAYKLASSTSRIGLATPIQSLQGIKRDVEALDVPKCLTTARRHLSDHMIYTIDGFLAFMSQKPDSEVQNKFSSANISLTQYSDEMDRIVACVPNCN